MGINTKMNLNVRVEFKLLFQHVCPYIMRTPPQIDRYNNPIYHHHHHHHVAPPARISLTVSRHFSLSFIASGRSSGLHPVSLHSEEVNPHPSSTPSHLFERWRVGRMPWYFNDKIKWIEVNTHNYEFHMIDFWLKLYPNWSLHFCVYSTFTNLDILQ